MKWLLNDNNPTWTLLSIDTAAAAVKSILVKHCTSAMLLNCVTQIQFYIDTAEEVMSYVMLIDAYVVYTMVTQFD